MTADPLFAAVARESRACCEHCGHSLTGLVEPTCSECGTGLAIAIVSTSRARADVPAWWPSLAGTLFGVVVLSGWLWSMWNMYAPVRDMALSFGQQPFGFWNFLREVIDWSDATMLSVAAATCATGAAVFIARWTGRLSVQRWERAQTAFALMAVVLLSVLIFFF